MGVLLHSDHVMADPSSRPAADTVRVMIVDDSLTVRTVFSRMIKLADDMIVVGTASTAESGIAELAATSPHVMLLDLEMPGMGGIEALPKIMEAAPDTKVLVISSLTADGAEATIKALSLGAADTMLKPRPGGFDDDYKASLLGKIRALKGIRPAEAATAASKPLSTRATKSPQVVAIGASTGGIHALNLFLRNVPKNFDLPILITQHLPSSFIPVFAKQMEMAAGREAILADEGVEILRGKIYIAPGHGHMVVRKSAGRHVLGLAYHPVKSGCMPSVDPIPLPPRESRFAVPEDAQDASYLAASANISSFCRMDICAMMFLLCSHLTLVHDLGCVGSFCGEQSAGFGRLLRCCRWRSMKG